MALQEEVQLPPFIRIAKYPTNGIESLGAADSDNNLFFARELEHIIPEMFEIEHARINARAIFPIDRSAGPTAKIITYRQFTKVGASKIISDYANDIPLVQVHGEEFTGNVRTMAIAARWTVDEIEDARVTGRPLDRMQTDAAREAILRQENDISFNGDATHGLVGLFTDPNIPTATVVNGAGGDPEWPEKTGPEMLTDMLTCVNQIPATTGDVEAPTRLLISTRRYNLVSGTFIDAGGISVSVLKWFVENNNYVKDVMPIREFEGVAAGGLDAMMAYTPDVRKIRMNITMELEQRPPQEVDLWVKVIYREKFGGLTVHKPLSLNICEGI